MNEREIKYDWIKGLLIVLMVFGHTERMGSAQGLINSIIRIIYLFHMPCFIIISGYFFSVKGHWERVGKAWSRLLKPYLIIGILYQAGLSLAKNCGIPTSGLASDTFWEAFMKLVNGRGGGALWFVYALFVNQMMMIGISYLKNRVGNFICAYICLVLLAISPYLPKAFSVLSPSWFLLYFCIGMMIKEFSATVRGISWSLILTCALGLIVLRVDSDVPYYVYKLSFLNIGLVCSALITLLWIAEKLTHYPIIGKWGVFLGQHTMPILCFHAIFSVLVKPILSKVLIFDSSGIVYAVCNVVVVIILSLLLEFVLKKIKLYRLIFM